MSVFDIFFKICIIIFTSLLITNKGIANHCISEIKYLESNYNNISYEEGEAKIDNSGCKITELSEDDLYEYYSTLMNFYNLHLKYDKIKGLNGLFRTSKLKISKKLEFLILISESNLNWQGYGDMEKAEASLKKAAEILPKIKDSSLFVVYYTSLANFENRKGNAISSIENHEIAIQYLPNSKLIQKGAILYNIGNILYEDRLYLEAVKNFKKSKKIFSDVAKERVILVDYALSIVYVEMDSLEQTKEIISFYENKDNGGFSDYFTLISAKLDNKLGDYTSSFQKTKKLLEKIESDEFTDKYSTYKLAALNQLALGNIGKSKIYIQQFLEQNEVLDVEVQEMNLRYEILSKIGLQSYLQFSSILDTINHESQVEIAKSVIQKNNEIREFKEKAQLELLQTANDNHKTEIKLKKKQLAISLFFLILTLGMLYFIYTQFRKVNKLSKSLNLQKSQIQLLNRELNHRVKNNLAFMTSLLEMQGRRTDNTETRQLLRESETRLKTLALVHANLFKNEKDTHINLSSYLTELVSHLESIFAIPGKNLDVNTQLTDFNINAEDAMRLGLIVNELVTNSIKHAFDEVENPSITIQTYVNDEGKLVLDYKDNGPGISTTVTSAASSTGSLGTKLISLLKAQLGDRYVIMV